MYNNTYIGFVINDVTDEYIMNYFENLTREKVVIYDNEFYNKINYKSFMERINLIISNQKNNTHITYHYENINQCIKTVENIIKNENIFIVGSIDFIKKIGIKNMELIYHVDLIDNEKDEVFNFYSIKTHFDSDYFIKIYNL